MRVTVFLVADQVLIDARSNRMSIVNICDEIHSTQFPFTTHPLTAVAGLELDDGDEPERACRMEIRCGENIIIQGSVPVEFSGLQRSRAMVEINAILVPENEDLHFWFYDGDDRIATWDIDIRQIDPAAIPAALANAAKNAGPAQN